MRFCHVSTYYPPMHFGGDAIQAQSICEGLAARGHEVTVVHAVNAFTMRQAEVALPPDTPGIRRIALRSSAGALAPLLTQQTGRPALLAGALRRILREPFDVVHFHNVSLIGGPGVFPLSTAPVTFHTLHDHWLFCTTHVLWQNDAAPCVTPSCLRCAIRSGVPPQWWRHGSFVSRCLEAVDCLIAPSAYTAQRHRAAGLARPMQHLPSFVRVAAETRAQSAPRTRFVYAGRLVKSKGVEQLLETVATRPHLALDVIGEGPLGATLRARYAASPHVTFRPMVSHGELPRLLTGATALVLPSWGPEVFPLTVLEAMACGVPVVVRRAGGSAEAVEDIGGGMVYDEPHELAPILERLAEDAPFRDALAAEALRGVREHYSETAWFERYFALIADIRAKRNYA